MRNLTVSGNVLEVFGKHFPHCRIELATGGIERLCSPALISLISELVPLLDEAMEDFTLNLSDGKGGESSPSLMEYTLCGADFALNLWASEGVESFIVCTFCGAAFAVDFWGGKGLPPLPVFIGCTFWGADFALDLCDGEGSKSLRFGTFCGADFTLLRMGRSDADMRARFAWTSGDCSGNVISLSAAGDISAVRVLQRFPIGRRKESVEAQADGS
jgi:hypothetical protein